MEVSPHITRLHDRLHPGIWTSFLFYPAVTSQKKKEKKEEKSEEEKATTGHRRDLEHHGLVTRGCVRAFLMRSTHTVGSTPSSHRRL